jgi:hypothetical protein
MVGLLATLYDSIQWYNQTGRGVNDKREIRVPFYFSTTGTERYLQDNFLNNIDFDPQLLEAEAFYNKIPRGICDFSGISIETSAIVNKYVRMNRLKQETDGTLNTYSYETYMVPMIMNVDCTVYLDSILDQFKCSEAIIKTFYKNKVYQVDIGYTRIPCLIMFPDEITNERTVEFSFTDKKEFKVTFSLQIKSHLPIFRPETEIFAGSTMQKFAQSTIVPPFTLGPTGIVGNTGVEAGFGSTSANGSPTVTGGGTGQLTTDHNANATRLIVTENAIPSEDPVPWPKPTDSQGSFNT